MGIFSKLFENAKGLGKYSEAEVEEWKQLIFGYEAAGDSRLKKLTQRDLEELSKPIIGRSIEIMNESITICEKTTNPSTFFLEA